MKEEPTEMEMKIKQELCDIQEVENNKNNINNNTANNTTNNYSAVNNGNNLPVPSSAPTSENATDQDTERWFLLVPLYEVMESMD